jgi:origin recognition complex subunit 2
MTRDWHRGAAVSIQDEGDKLAATWRAIGYGRIAKLSGVLNGLRTKQCAWWETRGASDCTVGPALCLNQLPIRLRLAPSQTLSNGHSIALYLLGSLSAPPGAHRNSVARLHSHMNVSLSACLMNPRSTPRRAGSTEDAKPTIIHVSGHTRPKRTPRQPTRSASRRIAQETKTPTSRRRRRKSKPESDDDEVPPSVLTSWLGEDELMDDADRSSSTDSDHSEEDSEAEMDKAMTGDLSSPTKAAAARKTKVASTKRILLDEPPALEPESFVNQTAFDLYFLHANRKLHISNHVLSALVEPLSKEEYKTLIARSDGVNRHTREIGRLNAEHTKWFGQYALELAQGFNLCFYGYGSKRTAINTFAKSKCATRGHVVVINGYIPSLRVKDVLGAIEQVPGLLADADTAVGAGIEGQTKRIYDFFRSTDTPALYLIVHNIDAPALRDAKARAMFSTLALHPRIHLVASVDSIHAPLLWSATEVAARKHTAAAGAREVEVEVPSARGYAWVFHDLTTFVPYDEEIAASRDATALPGPATGAGAGGLGDAGAGAEGPLTEVAVGHVLASVTEKARMVFRLLAMHQLAAIAESAGGGTRDDSGQGAPMGVVGMDRYGMQYDLLFQVARKELIATNDTALRALLGEFMDHGVVASVQKPGHPDVLWIPASKEALRRILREMGDA